LIPVSTALPQGISTVTWAFATGDCSNENWAGISPSDFSMPNVKSFANAGVDYILSTGGSAGAFTCGGESDMLNFLNRYSSKLVVGSNNEYMLGIDFDIEGGRLTSDQINSLVNSIAQVKNDPDHPEYANLRVSFTLATLAASDGSQTSLNQEGQNVMAAIGASGLKNYYINLMTMDYGQTADPSICVVSGGICDMGASAIQAAKNFESVYGVQYSIPMNRVELTPLIGVNDIQSEIFTVENATTVANYVKSNGLGGLHYWSFDRDAPCIGEFNNDTTVCYGNEVVASGDLPFATTFVNGLH
jgi:hypothetical protein